MLSFSQIFSIYLRLKIQRVLNYSFVPRGSGSSASINFQSGKRGIFTLAIAAYFICAFFYFHSLVIQSIQRYSLEGNSIKYLEGLAAYLFLLVCSSFLLGITFREITKPDSDLEWLLTLPVSRGVLLWVKALERTVLQPMIFLALVPGFTILLVKANWSYFSAALVALFVSLPISFFFSLWQSFFEHLMRMNLKPSRLRNMQAIFHLLGVLGFYFCFPRNNVCPIGVSWLVENFPRVLRNLPQGLVLRFLVSQEVHLILLLWIEILFVGMVYHFGSSFLLRKGVVSGGSFEREADRLSEKLGSTSWIFSKFSATIQKEFLLLSRDTNYLSQTILVPLFIVLMQQFLPKKIPGFHIEGFYAVQAFALSSYAMISSIFLSLSMEGPSLWLLQTVPIALEDLLGKKMRFWRFLSLIYWCLFLAIAVLSEGIQVKELFIWFIAAFVGIYLFSWIALALGILAFQETEQRYKIQSSYLYLYLLLSAAFCVTFFLNGFQQITTSFLLFGFLGLAHWQKAKEQIPFLLDPMSKPRFPVSIADGFIALFCFFQMQVLFLTIGEGVFSLFTANASAALLVWASHGFFLQDRDLSDFPKWIGKSWRKEFLEGIATAVFVVAVAKVYFYFYAQPRNAKSFVDSSLPLSSGLLWTGLLISPLFEEYVFRGILLNGFARFMGRSCGSLCVSLLYALVHPMPIALPMFFMSLSSGILILKNNSLLPGILVHLLYNLYFMT